MIPSLGSIIDRVTGLFGKTYFLAGFFPVLFLAGVSVLAGYDSSAWVHRQVDGFRTLDTGRQAIASGALLTAVATLGFVYWSANPWWRALLQGSVLPPKVRDWLVQDKQKRLAGLERELRACEDRVFLYRMHHPDPPPESEPEPAVVPAATPPPSSPFAAVTGILTDVFGSAPAAPPPPLPLPPAPVPPPTPTWMERLAAARERGDARQGAAVAAASPALVADFETVLLTVRGLEPVDAGVLDALVTRLEGELAAGPVAAGSELDRMQVEFFDLAAAARARAENARSRALSARRIHFPLNLSAVGPTRMANVAELYRDYALARYRLDPEVFWLHLQRSAGSDDRFRPILEEARLKLDVSVAMAFACGLASLWGVAVGLRGHSIPLLLLTGLGMPLAALLFYRATVTNLRVYGEAVRATVDLFRFNVLEALHLQLPTDSDAERKLWDLLTLSNQLLVEGKLTYEAAKP